MKQSTHIQHLSLRSVSHLLSAVVFLTAIFSLAAPVAQAQFSVDSSSMTITHTVGVATPSRVVNLDRSPNSITTWRLRDSSSLPAWLTVTPKTGTFPVGSGSAAITLGIVRSVADTLTSNQVRDTLIFENPSAVGINDSTIVILNINDRPSLTAPSADTIVENSQLVFDIVGTDANNDAMTIHFLKRPLWADTALTVQSSSPGTTTWRFRGTPLLDDAGADTAIFQVSDGRGGLDTSTTIITIDNLLPWTPAQSLVDFGLVDRCPPPAFPVQLTYSLQNVSGDSLLVDSAWLSHPTWITSGAPSLPAQLTNRIANGGLLTFSNITFNPIDTGVPVGVNSATRNFHVKVRYATKALPTTKVIDSFPILRGSGCAGIMGGTRTINFGNVEFGSNLLRDFTVIDSGACPLTAQTPSLTGSTTYSINSPVGFTLAGGANRTFSVQFTPSGIGAFNGSVVITHDGFNSPYSAGTACNSARQYTINLTGTGVDTRPPVIDSVAQDLDTTRIIRTFARDIGAGIKTLSVNYRLGNQNGNGTALPGSAIAANVDSTVWTLTLPLTVTESDLVTFGIECKFIVSDKQLPTANSDTSEWISVQGYFSEKRHLRSRQAWLDGAVNDSLWHLVSIPGQLDTNTVAKTFVNLSSMTATSGDDFTDQWRLLRHVPGTKDSYTTLFSSSASNSILPGESYWFKSHELVFDTLFLPSGRTAVTSTPFSVSLDSGWNFIGNPYLFPVKIASVTGAIVNTLAKANPANNGAAASTWVDTLTLGSSVLGDTLQPWVGYIVFSTSNGTLTLDPHTTVAPSLIDEQDGWRAKIDAFVGSTLTGRVVVGSNSLAADSEDGIDRRLAPLFGLQSALQSETDQGLFAADFRSLEGVQTWNLALQNSDEQFVDRLRWQLPSSIDSSISILLIDKVTNRQVDMTTTSSFVIENPRQLSGQRLRVMAGPRSEVQSTLASAGGLVRQSLQLYQNYPNPFNPSTTLSFDLPQAGAVRLTIFNILGQEVTTLINESRSAGAYQVEWHGKSSGGAAVASGVYFARLQLEAELRTIRLLLLK